MAAMNPILRLRRAFLASGLEEAQAEDVVDALEERYTPQRETDIRYRELLQAMERRIAESQRSMTMTIIILMGLGFTILGTVLGVLIALLNNGP